MASSWESEPGEEAWCDREAWRGNRYPDIAERWQDESPAAPERTAEEATGAGGWCRPPALEDWPEELAGPEYWMYKQMGPDRAG